MILSNCPYFSNSVIIIAGWHWFLSSPFSIHQLKRRLFPVSSMRRHVEIIGASCICFILSWDGKLCRRFDVQVMDDESEWREVNCTAFNILVMCEYTNGPHVEDALSYRCQCFIWAIIKFSPLKQECRTKKTKQW